MGLGEMTYAKFTDEQIIRCLNQCKGTDFTVAHLVDGGEDAMIPLQRLIDIINRQKAQIEQLQKNCQAVANKHYANGIADLADRLESNIESGLLYEGTLLFHMISKTVKEMAEEKT